MPLTITATSVLRGTGSEVVAEIIGETMTAGQVVYKDSTSGKVLLADAAGGAAAAKTIYGIALNGGAVDQPTQVLKVGPITIGATVAVGTIYILSATAGGIDASTVLASGMTTCILGVGISVTQIRVAINNSGVAVP